MPLEDQLPRAEKQLKDFTCYPLISTKKELIVT